MARFLLFFLIIVVLPATGIAGSPDESTTVWTPLAKAIEGLAPGPRIAYLEYLLKTNGGDPEVYFQLGVAFYEDEQADSALFYYSKAAELDSLLSKAYVNMGVILDERQDRQGAIGMFEKAVAVNPQDVLAHAHAAYMLFDAGEYGTAWEHLSKALAIDSLNPQPHFYLAIFFWESGMFRESLVEFERVVSLANGDYLSRKAEENIAILQRALRSPAGQSVPEPRL
jgi:tetratricopeptide (TPR) repeat protein